MAEEIKKSEGRRLPPDRSYFSIQEFKTVAEILPDHRLELIYGEIVENPESLFDHFSVADFRAIVESLPDLWLELINGELEFFIPPDEEHQDLTDRVIRLFAIHSQEIESLGCRIVDANCFFEMQAEYKYEEGVGPSVVSPDAAVCYKDYHKVNRHPPAPLIVEVISCTYRKNPERDLLAKPNIYAALGISAYWVVDRRDTSVWVHTGPREGRYALREHMIGDQILPAPGLEFLQATPARIFEASR